MDENQMYPPSNNESGSVQPGIQIPPEINPEVTPPTSNKSWLKPLIIGGGVIVLFAIVGILGYSQGYTVKGLSVLTPSKVWDKFYTSDSAKIYNTSFTAEYNDPESFEGSEEEFGVTLKNIKLHLEGSNYANLLDTDKPEVDGNIKFTVGSGNTSFSSGIEYRVLNKNVFYKIGDIPFLSGLIGSQKKNVDWVKINLDDVEKQAASNSSSDADFFKSLSEPAFQNNVRKIWLDNRAIKLNKYVGREDVNGVSTLHFKAALDKDSAKAAVIQTFDELAKLGKNGNITEDDKSILNTAVEKLLAKVEIKELDVWVGAKDQNLYKIHLLSNAPSFVSFAKLASSPDVAAIESSSTADQKKQLEDFLNKLSFDGTFAFDAVYSDYGKVKALEEPADAYDILKGISGSADDAKRVSDARQLASALELYFNDNSYYPYTLNDLTPTYIGAVPTAPNPAGGSCTADQNNYKYTYTDASHYKMSFCLGDTTGGISAGAHELSQSGIN